MLKKSRVIAALFIALFFPILSLLTPGNDGYVQNKLAIPLWRGSWCSIPESYIRDVNVTGKLSVEEYPVPFFSLAVPVNLKETNVKREVVVLDSGIRFILMSNERAFITGDNSYGYLAYGTRISNVTLAAVRGYNASIEGYAFYIESNSTRYNVMIVEKVNIHGDTRRTHYPIFVDWIGYSSLEELTDHSRLIILGQVNDLSSSIMDGTPLTEYTMKVEKFIKKPENEFNLSNANETLIQVAMFGAETLDSKYESRINPLLSPSERVILFLNGPDERGNYGFPGSWGRFHVIESRVYSIDVLYPDRFGGSSLSTRVEDVSLNFFMDLIKFYSTTDFKSPS